MKKLLPFGILVSLFVAFFATGDKINVFNIGGQQTQTQSVQQPRTTANEEPWEIDDGLHATITADYWERSKDIKATKVELIEEAQPVKESEPAPKVEVKAEPKVVEAKPEKKPAAQKVESKKQTTQRSLEPSPEPKPVVSTNKLLFAGSSLSYQFAGAYNPTGVQNIIDSGIVSASITNFNGNDGQTTYFSGHNPGVMRPFYNNLAVGSIVSVADSNGTVHDYQMIDVVKTDTSGKVIIPSLGISAGQLYYMGSGQESIAIQYCVNGSSDMRVWYGVKV